MPSLPPAIETLRQTIQDRYPVAFETLNIGGEPLHLLQVQDIEPLLAGKDPFADTGAFPFWVKLWESSMALAAFVATLTPRPGETLLELGAGLGAPGLAAARRGFAVTLTDYEEEILDIQRVNAAANGLDNVTCRLLDWKAPPQLERYDTIIGAEILFREEFFAPLLNLFDTLLAPDGVIYLAHDMRRKSLPAFLRQAEDRFSIEFSTRTMRSDEETLTVVINRLRPRRRPAN